MTLEWVGKLIPSFEGVLRAMERTEGFALHPVQVPGPDVGYALADWLAEHGWPTRVVEPFDDAGWRAVVANIVDPPPRAHSAVMVIGGRKATPAIFSGLRILNQRRDTIVEEVAGPLLWCGPLDFLNTTWEGAPDVWSIRAMVLRIESHASMPPESPLWGGVVVNDAPERLRQMRRVALEQGDDLVSMRVGLQLLEVLLAGGEFDEASELVTELRADPGAGTPMQRGMLELLRARAALARRDRDEGLRAIAAAEEISRAGVDGEFEALLALARANVAMRSDVARAIPSYQEAIAQFRLQADKRNEAVAIADLGVAYLALGEAEKALELLELAWVTLREVGDDRGEARCLTHIGRAHAALRDSRTAIASFEEALARVRALGDRRGEARILCHLARVVLAIGDAEKAAEDASRSLAMARDVADERTAEQAAEVLLRADMLRKAPSS